MKLQTKVDIDKPGFTLDYRSRVMILGSCFAESMGGRLAALRFKVDLNPCGIVYNPFSVANVLKLLMENKTFTENDLLPNDNKWVSLYHHGSFSSTDREMCLKNINDTLATSAARLRETDLLIITWGTAWVYRHKESGVIVSNCHKIPATAFERFRLSVADIVNEYKTLICKLREINPGLKILFTVSPIRHWKDGAHGNQLSKATLLLAIDELTSSVEGIGYFPSYEIVLDELRDYRFYAEDMLHVSDLAVGYIWERFQELYLSPDVRDLMQRIDRVNRMLAHRPTDRNSREYQALRSKIQEEIAAITAINAEVGYSVNTSSVSMI